MGPRVKRRYVPLRQVDWRIVLGLIALNTVCLFFYRQLDYVANALHRSPLLTFAEEAAGGLAGLAVFPLIYEVAIRYPLVSTKWRVYLPVHLAAVCVISIVHTTLIAAGRMLVFPVLGFGGESYGYMPARYPMEFSHLFIYYWVMVSLIYFFHELRFAREREVQEARLQSDLAEAQLQNLRLQLEPHFLFNTLTAISAAIYEDPRAADEMIGRLSELLRALLQENRAQLVPLAREMELLGLYLHLMQARLEHRLAVSMQVAEEAKDALVPQLILQPLVENAIRHGMDERFEARIEIRAECLGEGPERMLRLSVRDYGPGLNANQEPVKGIGLSNTVTRLKRLYGEQQRFSIRNAPECGVLVAITLPSAMAIDAEQRKETRQTALTTKDVGR